MKTWVVCFCLLSLSMAQADIRMPGSVKKLDALDSTIKQAAQANEFVILIMVNAESEQDYVADCFRDYNRRLKTFGPVVHVPVGYKEAELRFDEIKAAFKGLKGKHPKIVVFDPKQETVVGTLGYVADKDRKDRLNDLRSALRKYKREQEKARLTPGAGAPR